MAHINSIGAGLFSDLSVTLAAVSAATLGDNPVEATLAGYFDNEASTEYERIRNVREFPSIGTPPNLVNVPVYGSKTSQQIQGQSDPTSMELTINYVPADWAAGTDLGDKVGDGMTYLFRFVLMNSEPDSYNSTSSGLGTVQNSCYYWLGKVEALLVNPQLTDANTATLTLSIQSKFFGAYTIS